MVRVVPVMGLYRISRSAARQRQSTGQRPDEYYARLTRPRKQDRSMNVPFVNVNSSGLDIQAMVKAITQAEIAPKQAQIDRREKAAEVELTGLGRLLSVVTPTQQSAALLSSEKAWQVWQADSADSSRVRASVSGKPNAGGAHEIVVRELAAREKLLAGPFAPVFRAGEGGLEISVAGGTFKVDIKADMTLQAIAAAVNSIARQYGARMDVLKDSHGQQVLLSATESGANQSLQITGHGGMATFAEAFAQMEQGRDASFTVDGVELYSHDNRVKETLSGVTLDLLRAEPGHPVRVSVGSDYSAVVGQVSTFLTGCNALVQAARPNAADGWAGRLESKMATSLLEQVRTVLRQTIEGGAVRSLVDVGVQTLRDGSLSLDEGVLVNALADHGPEVMQLLTGSSGIMPGVSKILQQWSGPFGVLGTRVNTLSNSLDQTAAEREKLALYEQVVQDRTQRQFFAMDRQMGRLKAVGERLDLLTSQMLNIQRGKRR